MDEKKWYVLRTNPRSEKKVAERLTSIGIDHYLPLHKQLKIWHDRKKYVDEVLFKSYIFIYTTEAKRQDVFAVSGIVKYLFVSGKIAVVTEKEIEQIRIFCTLADVKVEENCKKGDLVEVIAGQFIGLRGELVSETERQKLQVHIPVLNCFASISIDKNDVVKIV